MIKKLVEHLGLSLVLILITACGQGPADGSSESITNSNVDTSVEPADQSAQKNIPTDHPGQIIYNTYCRACHQADGRGVPGMHPSIVNTRWVADSDTLIMTVLKGVRGPIEVNGESFNQIMPAQDYLTDQQIADVLSFIRISFGNDYPPIDVEQVKRARDNIGVGGQ